MNISKLYNPYDFGNPVSDSDLFVGRKEELSDIRYYLEHAKTAPRPINLALLGPRASGKTSLLNMIEIEARKRDECPVRINLDEDDVKSQLSFFYKLFDAILTEVCRDGAFGGKEAKTFDTYLDIVNAYSIPEDKTFCPFVFPIQYAKAMSSGNPEALLSDGNFKHDLAAIRTESGRPIIVMFDEGNILANSRSLLEKLRNIFMNTPGFMLVLTGTPDLFPVIDEVFSPIVRQFKKINVGEFREEGETRACIRKPLEKIGVKPEQIFDFETITEVEEIHSLSGGRPYEIQLLCFMLFKRVQTRRARKMRLDLSVLEEVRKELETSQDITTRPLLTKIRNLQQQDLLALKLLCSCNGLATIDQIWAIEYIFDSTNTWERSDLDNKLEFLESEGIVQLDKGLIKFIGDDFDKIYAKYFAREQGVLLNFEGNPLEYYWSIRLNEFLSTFEDLEPISNLMPFGHLTDFSEIASKLGSNESDEDIFVEDRPIAQTLYRLMIAFQGTTELPIVQLKVVFSWLSIQMAYFTRNPNSLDALDSSLRALRQLARRSIEVGAELTFEKRSINVASISQLARKVEKTANEQLRNSLADYHVEQMSKLYLKGSPESQVALHADLAFRYNPQPEPPDGNNIGYVFMSLGDLERARVLLENEREHLDRPFDAALSTYNLGILHLKLGDIELAKTLIAESITASESIDKRTRACACLFVPRVKEEKLFIEEYKQVGDVDLLDVASEAQNNLQAYSASLK